ncbi:MAG: Smr/MutS family protein [Bacteroidales bacterium]|nr:Smr/MutS family protein [Bacteroidales bacterium]
MSFEKKIGFDIIKSILKDYCLFEIGVEYVNKIQFSSKHMTVEKQLSQSIEFKNICQFHPEFTTAHFYDLRPELKRIETPNTYINPENLFKLLLSLESIHNILEFFKKAETSDFPFLKELSAAYRFDSGIIKKGKNIIDENSMIKDTASDSLFNIRAALKTLERSRDKKINQIFSQLIKSGFSPDSGITIRNGRYVIPVFPAYKRQVKGFIYDESTTGQTVFIEPAEVFELNNQMTEKENEEKREIIIILTSFTNELRLQSDDILNCFNYLGIIDFIRAKAKLAISLNAIKPQLHNKAMIHWEKALHPLLYLKNKEIEKKTIPLNLSLDENERILVISGPNAGGKSVCLKTVGLLQYMLQCGIPIPMNEDSKAGIFKKLFIDIGDEQSLENDLSTYSSHLHNMNFFMTNADTQTLFLIDEMGSGTEPQIGGAIAEAVLEKLNEQKSFGVITTHYSNLKMLAGKHQGIINGAMLFDNINLQPLFELKTREQGSSFAFEIARKTGLPKDVIDNAKSKIDENIVNFESYYLKVKEKEMMLEDKLIMIDKSDEILKQTYEKYQTLLEDLEKEKKEILMLAKSHAHELIQNANKKVEHLIKSIKENQAEKQETIQLRKELDEFKKSIKPEEITPTNDVEKDKFLPKKERKVSKNQVLSKRDRNPFELDTSLKPLEVNDYVVIEGQHKAGIITDINEKYATALFGEIRIKTELKKLKRIINYTPPTIKVTVKRHENLEMTEKIKSFKSEIDIRGKRAEEALRIVDHFIDTAMLCGVGLVRILHGKGDGILRKLIQESLRQNIYVEKAYDEHIDFGGQGITVVKMK